MPAAPIPFNEAERLAALHALCLLDTPTDPAFDLMTQLAAAIFEVPIAVISLLDEGRQWFKSKVGLAERETPRDQAFCAYAIHRSSALVVLDASKDERFADNPLVTGPPYIRFYAGMPLVLESGLAIGTLCIIDNKAHSEFAERDSTILKHLSMLVLARLRTLQAVGHLDPLTLLPNRVRFEEDLRLHAEVDPAQTVAAVADVCTAAHYRDMMNALGSEYAEQFLLAARDRLVQAISPAQLYRADTTTFGFTLTLEHAKKLRPALENLSAGSNQVVELQGIPQLISYAIGSVRLRKDLAPAETLRLLFAAAEQARQHNQIFSFYESEHDQSRKRSFSILSSLTLALTAQDQLSLHYQPRINLSDGRCCGVEALLRWRHPVLGAISPGEFIPLAEKTALMKRITRWVLQAGLHQATQWQRAGRAFTLALNVSALDLDRPNFVDELWNFVERSGADPSGVELEFTESAISSNPERVYEQLLSIQTLGVKIAIDDFGTGYSNLNYLKKVPASSLKIDQSFIRSLLIDRRDSTIVPAMIRLGHELGYRVVAEGIETEQVAEQLLQWGCDEGQGYWIAKPMSLPDLEIWLDSHPH